MLGCAGWERSTHHVGEITDLAWKGRSDPHDGVDRRKVGEHQADWDACRAQGAPLPELVQGVAHGLAFLHSQTPPILHRDLNPKNMLVEATWPPKAKLTDFSMSVLVPEGREVNVRAGAGTYMAPEVQSRSACGIAASRRHGVFRQWALPDGGALQAAKDLQAAEEDVPLAAALAGLAMDCLQTDPESRPLASEVLARLGDNRRRQGPGRSSS